MEKLIIHNFAGILDATIEVSPITGLIGPQASGKSVIAKLLYFFREIASRIPAAVADGFESSRYKAECCGRFNRYFPLGSLGATEFEVTYFTQNEHVRVLLSKEDGAAEGGLLLEWSDFYPTAIDHFARRRKEHLTVLGEADKDAISQAQRTLREEYDQEVSKVLGPWSKFEQIFIPAGRAFFSQVRASVFTSLESGEALDPFTIAFGSHLERSIDALGIAKQ